LVFDFIGEFVRIIARTLQGPVRTAIRMKNFEKNFFTFTDLDNFEPL